MTKAIYILHLGYNDTAERTFNKGTISQSILDVSTDHYTVLESR